VRRFAGSALPTTRLSRRDPWLCGPASRPGCPSRKDCTFSWSQLRHLLRRQERCPKRRTSVSHCRLVSLLDRLGFQRVCSAAQIAWIARVGMDVGPRQLANRFGSPRRPRSRSGLRSRARKGPDARGTDPATSYQAMLEPRENGDKPEEHGEERRAPAGDQRQSAPGPTARRPSPERARQGVGHRTSPPWADGSAQRRSSDATSSRTSELCLTSF